MKLIGKYQNGNYDVSIFSDGTKIRYTDDDDFVPEFAECYDVKITDKCSQGCKWCYEGCKKTGKHADLLGNANQNFLNSLHPYTEVAINGNDLDHPQLEGFLNLLKLKKVIVNITVNQNQFLKNFDKLKFFQENLLVRGIGVSFLEASDELVEKVGQLNSVVLHTINGILSKEDIDWLKDKGFKILILGYKNLKRGSKYLEENQDRVKANQMYLKTALPSLTNSFSVISFDNLSLEQLDVKRMLSDEEWNEMYMGDDGMFTFYVDLVKGEYAKSSLDKKRYKIDGKTCDEMFQHIRKETSKKLQPKTKKIVEPKNTKK